MNLEGRYISLEPLQSAHRETIRALARDERIWEYTRGLLLNDTFNSQFDRYFDTALELVAKGGQSYVIRLKENGDIIGMTRIYDVEPKDKRLAIGYTWYVPGVWGMAYNKDCKLVLLQYAFETLQYTRVEFFVAHQNIRSQKAVEKIGGVKEGVLRNHGYRNDGSVRHTVVYSIISDEWPEKKERLVQLIQSS